MIQLRQRDLNWRAVEGEVVALDVRAGRYVGVNRSGRLLWEALASGASRQELVELLISSFDVDRARAAADVDEFIGALRAQDLITGDDDRGL